MSVAGPRARLTDPATSHEAAEATETIVAASQREVVRILTRHGAALTDTRIFTEHVVGGQWLSPSRLRTARHELVEAGAVEAVGSVRPFGSRSRHTLWGLTNGGQ